MGELVELDQYRADRIIEKQSRYMDGKQALLEAEATRIAHERMAVQHLKKCIVGLPMNLLMELNEFLAEVIIVQEEG